MAIDFFKQSCKSSSSKAEFGLYDKPAPAQEPAYIMEDDREQWIATVKNQEKIAVDFYALDSCLELLRDDGTMQQRCDGMLKAGEHVVFVELKERGNRNWFKSAKPQLIETIDRYRLEHGISEDVLIKAYACNKLKPKASQQRIDDIVELRAEHRIDFRDKAEIDLSNL